MAFWKSRPKKKETPLAETFRAIRDEPGPWIDPKGDRVAQRAKMAERVKELVGERAPEEREAVSAELERWRASRASNQQIDKSKVKEQIEHWKKSLDTASNPEDE